MSRPFLIHLCVKREVKAHRINPHQMVGCNYLEGDKKSNKRKASSMAVYVFFFRSYFFLSVKRMYETCIFTVLMCLFIDVYPCDSSYAARRRTMDLCVASTVYHNSTPWVFSRAKPCIRALNVAEAPLLSAAP